jgi:hypothetical protein
MSHHVLHCLETGFFLPLMTYSSHIYQPSCGPHGRFLLSLLIRDKQGTSIFSPSTQPGFPQGDSRDFTSTDPGGNFILCAHHIRLNVNFMNMPS